MKRLILSLFTVLLIAACSQQQPDLTDSAQFVTKLGNDTLVVEQFNKSENGMIARVMMRSPELRFSTYNLNLDESGGIQAMIRLDHPAEGGFSAEGDTVQTIVHVGDSLVINYSTVEGTRRLAAEYREGTLPFIDQVHWPYELALNRAAGMSGDTLNQPLLSGSRISNFVIARMAPDSMTVRHPSRGVMGVDVANGGNLQFLDAGLTTRKLKVDRVAQGDLAMLEARFREMGQVGELSGAREASYTVQGADFTVTHGVPMKRGRDIFGGIVPWGQTWRTGANAATHFSTSADLMIGDLEVPAGEYTLFTIPEEDGGTLMINRETGINGQSYDPEMDLGRVPMQIGEQDTVTEAFTITVEEQGEGGVLKLIWDRTVFSIPFQVQ
ncbi:MAG: DUF2911 domain-containing protein [Balneolaceae bacterium]|nr:DUF2911 domain-containing protein [Balneolaceae bacterium]